MVAMRMVKLALYQVIDVIAVWHTFMPAARTVSVLGVVGRFFRKLMASIRIHLANGDNVFLYFLTLLVNEMPVL